MIKLGLQKTGTHSYRVGEEVYLLDKYVSDWDQFNTSRTLNGLQVGCGWVKPSEIELVERYEYKLVLPEEDALAYTLKVGDKIKIRGEDNEVKKLNIVHGKMDGVFFTNSFMDFVENNTYYYYFKHDKIIPIYKLTLITGDTNMTTSKKFTKADLKTGMRLEFSNNVIGIIMLSVPNQYRGNCDIIKYIKGSEGFDLLSDNFDTTSHYGELQKILEPSYVHDLLSVNTECRIVWEREAPKSKEQIAYEEAVEASEKAREAYELAQKKLKALNPAGLHPSNK